MDSCEPSSSDGRNRQDGYGKFKRIWLNLRCELPDLNKCCFCLPLRRGFLTLIYIKLVISVLLFLFILYFLILVYFLVSTSETLCHVLSWSAICTDTVDIVIGILTIVSAHKKSIKSMEFYYKYSVYVFLFLMVVSSTVFYMIVEKFYAVLILMTILSLILCLQIYIVLMVRSEALKLRSNAQFQFLNNETEPQCTYVNVDST